ncbi:hypothetical protein C0Q70_20178 [Pomacea canaliculata]|uniref:Uncharacterized protein n=1 Tax=Pomacea canaliculata TaxID=400727 RepID=A0A2T7NEU1_POMCA|nr:hypothetical protein C0Q70_20178 [Pomacea canaliculata]
MSMAVVAQSEVEDLWLLGFCFPHQARNTHPYLQPTPDTLLSPPHTYQISPCNPLCSRSPPHPGNTPPPRRTNTPGVHFTQVIILPHAHQYYKCSSRSKRKEGSPPAGGGGVQGGGAEEPVLAKEKAGMKMLDCVSLNDVQSA